MQLRVTPLGGVELLSTHDQLLGGVRGQSFLGSVFAASDEYARAIADEALKVGSALGARGVIGRFAVDFLTARTDRGWKAYAIELNLRKGGTTHPYLTLQFLTDGAYDAERALFLTPAGNAKSSCPPTGSSPRRTGCCSRTTYSTWPWAMLSTSTTPQRRARSSTMMTALGRHGLIGLTAVGNTRDQARTMFERTRDAFDNEARAASRHQELPLVD